MSVPAYNGHARLKRGRRVKQYIELRCDISPEVSFFGDQYDVDNEGGDLPYWSTNLEVSTKSNWLRADDTASTCLSPLVVHRDQTRLPPIPLDSSAVNVLEALIRDKPSFLLGCMISHDVELEGYSVHPFVSEGRQKQVRIMCDIIRGASNPAQNRLSFLQSLVIPTAVLGSTPRFSGSTDAVEVSGGARQTASSSSVIENVQTFHDENVETHMSYLRSIATMEASYRIKTPLYHHQKQALWWLRQRSMNMNSSDSDGRSVASVVPSTGSKGAILADEMGLGKTLTALAFIADYIDRMSLPPSDRCYVETGNVIIVCLASLENQWASQIKKHCQDISVILFSEARKVRSLFSSDKPAILIISYTTLASCYSTFMSLGPSTTDNNVLWELFCQKHAVIVLDEAHVIKNIQTLNFEACFALRCSVDGFRLALTGTPIQNHSPDALSLLLFCRMSCFAVDTSNIFEDDGGLSDFEVELAGARQIHSAFSRSSKTPSISCHSETRISLLPLGRNPFDSKTDSFDGDVSLLKLNEASADLGLTRHLMDSLKVFMLRRLRSHSLTVDGKPIVDIPASTIEVVVLPMTPSQHVVYDACVSYIYSMSFHSKPHVAGSKSRKALKHRQLLGMLRVLQQAADHGVLPFVKKCSTPSLFLEILHYARAVGNLVELRGDSTLMWKEETSAQQHKRFTPIYDSFNRSSVVYGCVATIVTTLAKQGVKTANSTTPDIENDRVKGESRRKDEGGEVPRFSPSLLSPFSNKVDFICSRIPQLLMDDPNVKVIVFSQFVQMLNLAKVSLDDVLAKHANVPLRTTETLMFSAKISKNARSNCVARFSDSPTARVLFCSIMAGGIGLDLVAASHLFLLDPWWNPGVDEQAFDRIRRIGQKRNTFIYRLVSKGTVEEKILSLQSKKKVTALFLQREETASGTRKSSTPNQNASISNPMPHRITQTEMLHELLEIQYYVHMTSSGELLECLTQIASAVPHAHPVLLTAAAITTRVYLDAKMGCGCWNTFKAHENLTDPQISTHADSDARKSIVTTIFQSLLVSLRIVAKFLIGGEEVELSADAADRLVLYEIETLAQKFDYSRQWCSLEVEVLKTICYRLVPITELAFVECRRSGVK